ncbi:MAG TPA: hypothetical protein VNJ52_08805 [Patescibacteria group bacterium]|nr:hypothetical protein [Patescibacteria group bacterium]
MREVLAGIVLSAAMLAPQPGSAAQNRARELAERTIANQHRNDAAIYDYERVEERISYANHAAGSDETYRLVPTGTGRLGLLVKRGNQPVDLATYRNELRAWRDALHLALDPGDPAQQRAEAKRRERDRKRSEMIDAVGRAFRFKWLGEEVVDGRTLAKIELDPNPSFQPASRAEDMLRHVRATAWIDVRAAQLVRGRAEITSGITIAGGIVAKIYPGGWYQVEQAEFAPGVWFPVQTEYSIRGRLFLFSVSQHKLTRDWDYRYVGPPRRALELARKDLASNALFPASP